MEAGTPTGPCFFVVLAVNVLVVNTVNLRPGVVLSGIGTSSAFRTPRV